ncbi:MAG: extracellular solute-binding protein, partial [Planctomycetes bacterium]|nr:extracellular solute-binding protein [Planctomycetota bacterium]
FIPIPSVRPDTEPTLMTGERAAIGVWKDSKNKAEALAFIGFLARPESIFAVASAGGNPAGLTTTTSDTGVLKPFYAKYADIQTFPVFDRAYLPSGMWDTLGTIGVAILAGSMNENEALERFEAEYNRLIKQ